MSDSCTEITHASLIKVEENGKKAFFKNPDRKKYAKTEVDGCLINDGIRCDYLVNEVGVASVLIELKGTDVKHAKKQLLASIVRPEIKKLLENKVGCLVISSQSPSFNAFIREAKMEFRAKHKAGFTVKTRQGEFNILDLVKSKKNKNGV
jgi:hypothetical protein